MKRKFKQSALAALLVLVMLIAAPVVSTVQDENFIQPGFTASALLSEDDPNLTREMVRQEMYDRYKRIYDFACQPSISISAQAVPASGTEAITAKAEEITADCSTNAEKAKAIYIWISDNIYYDYDFYEGRKNTAYLSALDVLEYKYTVCEGYANLYDAMCRSVGVPCRKVTGYSDTGHADDASYFADYFDNQSNHAWNEVYVDGEWIVVDTTWGSGNTYINGVFNKDVYTLSWYGMGFYEFTATHMGMSYDSTFESDRFDFEIYCEVITAGNYKGTATDIVIPEGVAVIEDMTATNKNITSVVFPSTLTTIGYEAFKDCTGLKSIVIPDTVTKVGNGAFSGCTALETAVIGSGITAVPSGCFKGCTALKTVDISEEITEIGSGAFYECSSLETITGAENVKILRSQAFMRCTLLKDCDFFNNLTRMEYYAIRECETLTSVTLPYTYSNIDEYNFYNCKSLKKIVIEGNVKYIDEYVFWGCTALEEVNIPSTVVTIGGSAFRDCTSLKSVTLPAGLTAISKCLFYNCSALESIGGAIPAGVTEIGEFAFRGCTSLEKAVLPEGLTVIGNSAFSSCSSLTDIGDAFPSGVTSIGSYAFYNAAILGDVTIPDGVTEIPECAFYQCAGITTLTIPTSVTSIADFAFCRVNGLTDIYYGGTEEQWNQITIGENNSRFLQAEIHFTEAHEHSYSAAITTPATCSAEGVKTFTCACGDAYTEAIAKTAHTEAAIPAVPATCTATGLTEGKKCSVCEEILVAQSATQMLAHTESDWIIDSNATCSKVGSKHIECTECKTLIKTESIAKTAHTEATIPAVSATCTDTGLTEGKKCSVCEEILVAQSATQMLAHTESDWIIDSNATCSKVGSKHIECTECKAVIKTEAIAKTAHTETTIPAVPATCTATGLTEGKKCSACEETLVAQTVNEMIAHTESDWIIDSNATCSKVGSKYIECTECKAVIKTEAIAKLAHTEAAIPAVPATCTATGLTEGKKCSACEEILVAQTATEMLAHTESDWIIDSNPTCSKAGSKHIECTECKAVIKTESIAKTAHTETAIPAVPATCTDTGLTEGKKCSVCEEILVAQTVTQMLAHTESDWIIDSDATCSKAGSKHIECTECKAVIKTEAIAKTAHTEAAIPAVPATCTATGLTEGRKCSVCGAITLAQKTTTKLSHTDSDGDDKCDFCSVSTNPADNCSHMCHKSGFMGFIWSIVKVFSKLFKINPVCECGTAHY